MKKVVWISNYGYENSYAEVTKLLLSEYNKNPNPEIDLYLLCIGQTQHLNFNEKSVKRIKY